MSNPIQAKSRQCKHVRGCPPFCQKYRILSLSQALLQNRLYRFHSQLWAIVLLAQMTQQKCPSGIFTKNLREDAATILVGQMSKIASDSLLQRPRIPPLHQHIHIVIAFDHSEGSQSISLCFISGVTIPVSVITAIFRPPLSKQYPTGSLASW